MPEIQRIEIFKTLKKMSEPWATMVHKFLTNYHGILISDFYPGYDAVPCSQQKCWAHLIRDLNNDLWLAPFDTEFETFVAEIRSLIVPIMQAVQRYGLKKRYLQHFRKSVDHFYEVIVDRPCTSECVLTYQKRFIRYRESLFTFLEYDGMPWHNNTAENAIRHLAIQRDMSRVCMNLLRATTLCYLVFDKPADLKESRFSNFCFRVRQTLRSLSLANANGQRFVHRRAASA